MTMPEFVDISDNNGLDINWDQVFASGVKGAICKCVQGDGSMHPGFLNNWHSISLAMLAGRADRRGAYNFCEGHDNPKADADKAFNLVVAAGGFTDPDDFLVMDCETAGITADWAYAALSEASMKLGRHAWLYCSYGWLVGNFHSDSRLAQFPLWIADINATLPRLPWPHALWQYTWRAQVPGIHSQVDGSRRGPAYDATLSAVTHPPLPVPPPTKPVQFEEDGVTVTQVDLSARLDIHGNGYFDVPGVHSGAVRSFNHIAVRDPALVGMYDPIPRVSLTIGHDSGLARIVVEGGAANQPTTVRVQHT